MAEIDTLRVMIADLQKFIDRRAADLAGPLIRHAQAVADEQIREARAETSRWEDTCRELRLQIEIMQRDQVLASAAAGQEVDVATLDRARVGDAVRTRRGELGLTQGQLAAKAEINTSTVSSLETGERWPWAQNRLKIEGALGWRPGSLTAIGRGHQSAAVEDPRG